MNKTNLKNLKKLADFLEKEITDEQFDISSYIEDTTKSGRITVHTEVDFCGAVGCAIGWASCLFYEEAKASPEWSIFARKVFGTHDIYDAVGIYMFSSKWERVNKEKTRLATIKRIREVVKQKGELTDKQLEKMEERYVEVYRYETN